MKKALKVARYEFLEKVKTKAFLIYMILFPLVIVGITLIPGLLVSNEQVSTRPIGILDETKKYSPLIKSKLDEFSLSDGQPMYVPVQLYLKGKTFSESQANADNFVINGELDGYILITSESEKISISYRNLIITDVENITRLEKVINEVRTALNLKSHGYNPDKINSLIEFQKLNTVQIVKDGDEKSASLEEIYFSSVILLMLLFMMILFSGGLLIRSLVEEKSNRIMEVLLSSCSANDLLTGKMLGLGLLGMFQLGVWTTVGFALFGSNYVSPEVFENIGLSLVYFILGYMLFTSIFVGVGSVVNTEQEAQQFTSYLSMVMILPLVISIKVIQNPDILLVKILSLFPLTSPPVMLLRLKILTPPLWEIILTIVILLLSIYVVIIISSKIFRIGILSYGKRPTLKELFQWLKEK